MKNNFYKKKGKRIFDILVALPLILIFSPLIIFIIILIKIDSKGPALFRQKRVGIGGKEFTMFKFRTMIKETPKYMIKPKKTDKRITKAGRVLRDTCFDELPQIFNILKGDMSLVGPRPEMPFIVRKYTKTQFKRLNVKPGLLGLWQVARLQDKVNSHAIHEDIGYDIKYMERYSFIVDLKIILRTLKCLLRL